jgi:cell division septal protein FtsQ
MSRRRKRKVREWDWRRGLRIAGTVVLVLTGVAALGALGLRVTHWVHQSPHFVLRQVEIAGHETLSPDDIRALYPLPEGSDLFEVDIQAMGEAVEQHPRVLRAVVTRHLPDRLTVRVIERVPVAQVLADRWYEVDPSAVVLGPVRSDYEHCLPKFFGVGGTEPLVAGSVLASPVAARLLSLIAALDRPVLAEREFDQKLSMFLVSENGSLMIPVDSSPVTVLVGREDWIQRLEKLAVVEPHRVNSSARGEWIDLRFEDQVVVGPMPRWGKELAQAFPGA